MSKAIIRNCSSIAGYLPPFIVFFVFIFFMMHGSGLPDNDYWDIISSVISPNGVDVTIRGLLEKSNEHIVVLPKLIFLLNYKLTGGDNFGLSVLACTFSLLISICLVAVIRSSAGASDYLVAVSSSIAVSLFAFPTLASHNFFIGMSGVTWIGANLFLVTSNILMLVSLKNKKMLYAILSIAFAFCSALFYSTGVVSLCVIGINLILSRRYNFGFLLLLLGIVFIFLIYLIQEVPGSHAERNFSFIQIALFCLTFIGGGVASTKISALAIGVVGVALFSYLAVCRIMRSKTAEYIFAFWTSTASYSIMVSGLGAIGRGNMGGVEAALAGRYATIPGLFWICLLGLVLDLPAIKRRCSFSRLVVAISLVLATFSSLSGLSRFEASLQRAKGKGLATLALAAGVRDDDLVRRYVTPAISQYYDVEPILRALHHVPYDGRRHGCPSIGSRLNDVVTEGGLIGSIDEISSILPSEWYRIRGWVAWPHEAQPPLIQDGIFSSYKCIAFVSETGIVVGIGLGGGDRPDVAYAIGRTETGYGWSGYIDEKFLVQSQLINAVVLDTSNSQWIKLDEPVEVLMDR